MSAINSPEIGSATSDRSLLSAFVQERDESAFAALVARYHAVVMGVCQRVLGNAADAEEAYQATFLVLARRARSQRWHEVIAGWLHQTAYRTALKLSKTRSRLQRREAAAAEERSSATAPTAETTAAWRELAQILDEELLKLPEQQREVLTLQLLAGLDRQEIAEQTGLSLGAVKDRLERAREFLRQRLVSRGVTFSVAALATWLVCETAMAAPPDLAASTTQAASAFAIGSEAAGIVPASTITLAEGILQMMYFTKLKLYGVAAAVLAFAATAFAMIVDSPDRFEKGIQGHIEVIVTSGARPHVTIRLDDFDVPLDLDLAPNVKVTHAFEPGKVTNLAAGTYIGVKLGADHRTVEEIHALGQTYEVTIEGIGGSGQFNQFAGVNERTLRGLVDDEEDAGAKSFELSPQAIIRIGGLPARREQLQKGMRARLELGHDSKLVNYVEVDAAEGQLVDGQIVELDAAAQSFKAKVELNDAEVESLYTIDGSTIIHLGRAPVKFSELKVGSEFQLRFVPGQSSKIEALVVEPAAPEETDEKPSEKKKEDATDDADAPTMK